MEYIFRTVVAMTGATGEYEVFKDGEQFLCVCLWWRQEYKTDKPAPVRIYKDKNKWKHTGERLHHFIFEQLKESIVDWKIKQ